jgi:hypothetical protein
LGVFIVVAVRLAGTATMFTIAALTFTGMAARFTGVAVKLTVTALDFAVAAEKFAVTATKTEKMDVCIKMTMFAKAVVILFDFI